MTPSVITSVLALNGAGLVAALLLTSAVIMLSVHQDLGLKAWIGVFLRVLRKASRGALRSVNRGIGGVGIELRKDAIWTPTLL